MSEACLKGDSVNGHEHYAQWYFQHAVLLESHY